MESEMASRCHRDVLERQVSTIAVNTPHHRHAPHPGPTRAIVPIQYNWALSRHRAILSLHRHSSIMVTYTLLASLLYLGGGVQAFVLPMAEEMLRSPPELPVPTRPLEWGDVNFISTSDTHGELDAHRRS